MAFDAEALGLPHGPADLAPARRASGKAQRADLLPRDRLTGFGFKTVEDGDGILHQPREVLLAAQLPHETRSVPGAAMGKLRLLDQQHVARTVARQVIGQRCPDGAASNDQDPHMAVGPEAHDFTLTLPGS